MRNARPNFRKNSLSSGCGALILKPHSFEDALYYPLGEACCIVVPARITVCEKEDEELTCEELEVVEEETLPLA